MVEGAGNHDDVEASHLRKNKYYISYFIDWLKSVKEASQFGKLYSEVFDDMWYKDDKTDIKLVGCFTNIS